MAGGCFRPPQGGGDICRLRRKNRVKVPRMAVRPTAVRRGREHLILVARVWNWSRPLLRRITPKIPHGLNTFTELPVDPNTWLPCTVAQVGKILKFIPT